MQVRQCSIIERTRSKIGPQSAFLAICLFVSAVSRYLHQWLVFIFVHHCTTTTTRNNISRKHQHRVFLCR